MLQVDELLELSEMPSWSEISLKLYRDFANKYLIPTCFRYYLANGKVLEIHFTEWGIYHMLGIQHINGKISNINFFKCIEEGLDFTDFTRKNGMRKRFYDMKHRIRSFACVYQIMKNKDIFYVPNNTVPKTSIIVAYIKYGLIDGKGVNIGIRKMDGKYIPYTVLIDRSSHSSSTIDKLVSVKINKLEIYRNGKMIEKIVHNWFGNCKRF